MEAGKADIKLTALRWTRGAGVDSGGRTRARKLCRAQMHAASTKGVRQKRCPSRRFQQQDSSASAPSDR